MKKLTNAISALAAVFLLLAGCTDKDSVTYSGHEAGNIQSGIFTTDNGVKMNIVGNDGKYDVNTERRVLVDYMTRPGADSKHIDIDISGLWDAQTVSILSMSALSKDMVDSPIRISDAWFNAGYLNLLASIQAKDVSKHMIVAAYDISANGITFRLYHEGTVEQSDTVQDIFACVPMDEITTSYEHYCESFGKKAVFPVPVLLQWTWYALDEKGPLMLYERKGTFNPAASN